MLSFFIRTLCRSTKFIIAWFFLVLVSCIGAGVFLAELRLDTNLIRLLPENSPVSRWTHTLQEPLGDGGYFSVLIESDDRRRLLEAVEFVRFRSAQLEGVAFVNERNPADFIKHYKYLLLPLPVLERLYDYVVRLEAEASPFAVDIVAGQEDSQESGRERNRRRSLERRLEYFNNPPEYHENADGTVIGVLIYPKSMVTELEALRRLYNQLSSLSDEVSREFGVWSEVGGSQIKNLREYKSIIEDLGRAGTLSFVAIIVVLFACFRSIKIIPIVVLPLVVGLAWAFAFVPAFIGPLNIITVFLMLILFGMGIDYSIHLIRHVQAGLLERPLEEVLTETFSTVGLSVMISGITTAFPLFVISFSNFRGFSDFGLIGGWAILMMLLAMFTVFPPLLIAAYRWGFLASGLTLTGFLPPVPRRWVAPILLLIFISPLYILYSGKLFDFNFSAHSSNEEQAHEFDEKHRTVFARSLVPAALYLAPNLEVLDQSIETIRVAAQGQDSTIERLTSIRDFAPDPLEFSRRLELIDDMMEIFQGNWYRNINDDEIRQWVVDFRNWTVPDRPAGVAELPDELNLFYQARDGSGRYVLGVYPAVSRRSGKDTLEFYHELRQFEMHNQLQGPIGEMVVFAEVLEIVLAEAPLMILLALISVVIPVYISNRSVGGTAMTLFPLVAGMLMLLGLMGLLGIQLNYLSIVIIPALLGLGVDDGVHYYRYCKAHHYNVERTQKTLFGTLSVCTLTTMIGYFGLVMAHNRGLQSLGILACLGMLCLWFTTVFLLPALLKRN